jgi:hypothetical protein
MPPTLSIVQKSITADNGEACEIRDQTEGCKEWNNEDLGIACSEITSGALQLSEPLFFNARARAEPSQKDFRRCIPQVYCDQ